MTVRPGLQPGEPLEAAGPAQDVQGLFLVEILKPPQLGRENGQNKYAAPGPPHEITRRNQVYNYT